MTLGCLAPYRRLGIGKVIDISTHSVLLVFYLLHNITLAEIGCHCVSVVV